MAAIVGVAGLQPTIDAIKISKTVALANKESIICGWEILSFLITSNVDFPIDPVDPSIAIFIFISKYLR